MRMDLADSYDKHPPVPEADIPLSSKRQSVVPRFRFSPPGRYSLGKQLLLNTLPNSVFPHDWSKR